MKVAIYGSAEDPDRLALSAARKIGALLAKKKHIVITGGSAGVPYEAIKAAYKAGGYTMGFSPATNKKDHVRRFHDPSECFSKLIYVPKDYVYVKNIPACYKFRNISTIMNCDKVLIIGGRHGTLDEFIQAYEFGKEIGVMKNTHGAADFIATDIMESSLKKMYKDTGSKVYFEEDPLKLLKAMKLL